MYVGHDPVCNRSRSRRKHTHSKQMGQKRGAGARASDALSSVTEVVVWAASTRLSRRLMDVDILGDKARRAAQRPTDMDCGGGRTGLRPLADIQVAGRNESAFS